MTTIQSLSGGGDNKKPVKPVPSFENSDLKHSLFTKMDKNRDGTISEQELIDLGYKENDLLAMKEVLFFAERNVNKWFIIDKNKNGIKNNVEGAMWTEHNENPAHKIGDMTPDEYEAKNNLKFESEDTKHDFKNWCDSWINDENPMIGLKSLAKERYGKDLNEEETQLLYDAMKNQANKWLFKSDSIYNRANTNAISTLYNSGQPEACCGGDVCYMDLVSPPLEEFDDKGNLIRSGYTKEQMEDRFSRVSGYMTEKQAEEYKKIIEEVSLGSWEVSPKQFEIINKRVNGNEEDINILKGKTRADIPPERQAWLKYLEAHDLLSDQFK